MATRDIRDYGAHVDGSTDDTAAVMDAIASAAAGDTVYFPPGTTMVYASAGPAVDLDDTIPEDLTLAGAGERSVLKMAPRTADNNAWIIGVDGNDSPITGLTVRDLVLDGNRARNPQFTTMGFNMYPGGAGHDVRIENVRAQNCSETGIAVAGGTTEIVHCTAINNGRQGFGVAPWVDTHEPLVTLRNVVAVDNDKVGIDHNSGTAVVDGFWSENNGAGGAKVPWAAKESTWRNGTFKANGTMGFRYNGDYREQQFRPFPIHLDNVVAVDNPWAGFWLSGDVDYDIGTIAAVGNNTSGRQHGNIDVYSYSDIDADAIYSNAAVGTGLFYSSNRQSHIGAYHAANNSAENLSGDQRGNLSVDAQDSDIRTLDVPSRDELGAWNDSTSSSVEPSLQSSGGSLRSRGGSVELR